MSKDLASLSTEDKAAFRAALGGIGYLVPIPIATFSLPAEYIDVALPSGYQEFLLLVTGCRVPNTNHKVTLAAALSKDAGVSFYCDPDNSDTYGDTYQQQRFGANFTSFSQDGFKTGDASNDDSLIPVSGHGLLTNFDATMRARISIYPGTNLIPPQVLIESNSISDDAAERFCNKSIHFLNPGATSTPSLGRINLIRLQPYGVADTPPSSGDVISAITLYLFGTPA